MRIGPVRRIAKALVGALMIRVAQRYTAVARRHVYRGVAVHVHPGVFHPGLFGSTHFLVDYLWTLALPADFHSLELGAGTGLISLSLHRRGGKVTATDISPLAIANLECNLASVGAEIICCDLFDNIPPTLYDIIVINPPYYPREPKAPQEFAWFCGEGFEYFETLFRGLGNYMHDKTLCIMVLSATCQIEFIEQLAMRSGFTLMQCASRFRLLDGRDYIFRIKRQNRARRATTTLDECSSR